MTPELAIRTVEPATLLKEVRAFRKAGYRLVQISATRLPDQVELTYSFGRETLLENLRVSLPAIATRLPSISSIYWCAFLYENELHDLFNVEVDGLAVDFHGNFYKTAVKYPFGSTKVPTIHPTTTPTTRTVTQVAGGNGTPRTPEAANPLALNATPSGNGRAQVDGSTPQDSPGNRN